MEYGTFVMKQQNLKWAILLFAFLVCNLFMTEPTWAVAVDALSDPIKELKTQIFGGWMMAVKIVAAAIGLIFSLVRGSLAPAGLGVGLAIGIHFFDKWLGDGADGALI